ncbi:unnamed protein product [Prorocentrum cordatum]|uniref:HMA domain-containing protein n=1 Tax=Prorocentrum cordatum TaxID=2364126 RepID=A0ABN9PS89_9DINO|nr:unnamed protein product [Polarella glacialis]
MRLATLTLLSAVASRGCSAASVLELLQLPEVSFHELAAGGPAAASVSRHALSTLGALAVVGVPAQDTAGRAAPLQEACSEALGAWASCLRRGGSAAAAHASQLANGAVRRASVVAGGRWDRTDDAASAFGGGCPPAERATSAMRSGVGAAARALAVAVDSASAAAHAELGAGAQLRSGSGRGDLTLAKALDLGSHLEHIRLYEEQPPARSLKQAAADADADEEAIETLSLHTDAGLMLAFVPPPTQAGGDRASLVELQLPSGEIREIALPSQGDAVIFLAGEAAHLLGRQALADDGSAPGLRPAPHALRLRPGFGWRAWYGAMLLPPEDAPVRGDVGGAGGGALTFGEVWGAARAAVGRRSLAEVPALGCGEGRLLADQVGGCVEGQVECWMTCMDVSKLQDCKGGEWRPTGVGDLAEFVNLSIQCVDADTGAKWPDQTGQMCPTCQPMCTLSSSQPAPGPAPGGDGGFCRTTYLGTGVTMYMDGFKMTSASPDEACVNFLLPSLVIDSPLKLVISSIGVVLLSASVELCTLGRQFLPKDRQGDVGLLFHAVSLVLAYLAMLFVMTYSIEIFSAVIVGLALGHKVAGAVARSRAWDLGGGSPCCRLATEAAVSARSSRRPASSAAAAGAESTSSKEDLATVRLSVKGMKCDPCAQTVRRALEGVEGVRRAKVSLQGASADVLCVPSDTTIEMLCEACSGVGFDARGADGL